MNDEEFGQLLVKSIQSISREYYGDKVSAWLIQNGLGNVESADKLVSHMFNEPVIQKQKCKGRLANGCKCTKPPKYNGYCGFHKKQYRPPNRPAPTARPNPRPMRDVKTNLIID